MKTIENKKIKILEKETNYFELALACVKATPEKGFTYELMEKIGRVVSVLKVDEKSANVEDADFNFILEKVNAMTWGVYDPEIKNFIDYIRSIK